MIKILYEGTYGQTIKITVTDSQGAPIDLTQYTVTVLTKLNTITKTYPVIILDGDPYTAYFKIPKGLLNTTGILKIQAKLKNDETKLLSKIYEFRVYKKL